VTLRAPLPLALLLLPALALAAQTGDGGADFHLQEVNPRYDGRFTFTRVRYGGPGFRGRGGSTWSHDYPAADRNMHRILDFLTSVRVHREGTNVFTLDDPEIFRNPILYLSEPGYWSASDGELRQLRDYLLKGGFLILDDFEDEQWWNMERNLKRALPEHDFKALPPEHPVFQTLLRIDDIYVPHPFVRSKPRYMGIFEDNDPALRLLVLANHNSDLAEYWEWSAGGFFPVDITNDAYALGVNYIVYGLTH
jgi:hypothetical protein